MEFDIKVWRATYDKVQALGQKLYDSYPHVSKNNFWKDAISKLSVEEQEKLIDEIKGLTDKASKYLEECNLHICEPLWPYNIKDKTTWRSHETFAYHHLLKRRR